MYDSYVVCKCDTTKAKMLKSEYCTYMHLDMTYSTLLGLYRADYTVCSKPRTLMNCEV